MSGSAERADFNRVRARYNCSIALEFELVRKQADQIVEDRNSSIEECPRLLLHDGIKLRCSGKRPNDIGMRPSVSFTHDNDRIVLRGTLRGGQQLDLALTLNDKAQCRYSIFGEGGSLRWQVLRTALEGLMFPPHILDGPQ